MTNSISSVSLSQEVPLYFRSIGWSDYKTTLTIFFEGSDFQQVTIYSIDDLKFHCNITPAQFLDLVDSRYQAGDDNQVSGIEELPSIRERIDEITRVWATTRINKMKKQIEALERRFLS